MIGAQAEGGESVIAGEANDATQYVHVGTGVVVGKQPIYASISKTEIRADGADAVTVSGLPVPCTVTVERAVYEVDDGVFEFTVDQPGDYPIRIDALHRLPKQLTVTAQ